MSANLERATAIVCEYLAKRPGVRSRLNQQTNNGLKAQSLEQTRDVISVSGDEDEEDEEAGGPRITDRTGETAIRSDRARRMLSELDAAETSLISAANVLIGHPMTSFSELTTMVVRHGYLFPSQIRAAAQVFDRVLGEVLGRKRPDPGKAADGRPGCSSCARLVLNRVPWFSEPTYNKGNPTTLNGELSKAVKLCDPCFRFAIAQEPTRLPTVAELRHRHDHPRGHWPRQYAPTKRAS